MGMSTSVVGVRDYDGKFSAMMAVKRACESAGTGYPQELMDYCFPNHPNESEDYLRRELEQISIPSAAKIEFSLEGVAGIQIELSKLPDDIKFIRFENSW